MPVKEYYEYEMKMNMNKMANFSYEGCFLRWLLGVCSIRVLTKNHGDPYYEPIIVVHDIESNYVLT